LIPIIIIAVAAWFIAAWLYPRHAVWFLLCWIPVQGWFQLNVFGNSNATVLLYEFQVIGLYLIFAFKALQSPEQFRPPAVIGFAAPFVVWVLLLIPSSIDANGLLTTLLGLRSRLLTLAVVWLGYRAFTTRRQLEGLGVALAIQLPLIAGVTALQFLGYQPSAAGDFGIIPVGFMAVNVLRPPGTFAAPGELGMYLLTMIPLSIGLLGLRSIYWKRAMFAAGLAAGTIALVVNTQRATIVLLAITVPLILLLARQFRAARIIGGAVGIAAVAGLIGTLVSGDALQVRVASVADDLRSSILIIPTERLVDAMNTPIFGDGLGIASPGSERLDAPLGTRMPINARVGIKSSESFLATLVYETGVPGLVMFVLYMGMVMGAGLAALRRCRGTDLGLFAAAIVAYEVAICLQSWTYAPLLYPPSRVLFWFWGGVLMSLPRLAGRRVPVPTGAVTRVATAPRGWAPRPAIT
jgi:hypothetical protein